MGAITKAPPPPAMRSTEIVPGWKWYTSREGDVAPASMGSRHLFYTLRMIWNHSMPLHMEVGSNVKRWTFGKRHTPKYMREAVVRIGAELFTRTDLEPWMVAELEQMARWLGMVEARTFIDDARALMLATKGD